MNTRLFVAAAIAALGFATASSAAITITAVAGDNLPAGETLITDFNSTGGTDISGVGSDQGGTITDLAPGFTFTQNSGAYTRSGSAGLDSGVSAPPPGDTGFYETVLGGGSATLTSLNGLTQFSFYMGSPDSYNGLSFTFSGAGGTTTLNGDQIWCQDVNSCGNLGDGNQQVGYTVTYNFTPGSVNSITFSSSGNSFEFDTLGGIAVPEPAAWGLMIMGFGVAGAMLRGKRKQAVA